MREISEAVGAAALRVIDGENDPPTCACGRPAASTIIGGRVQFASQCQACIEAEIAAQEASEAAERRSRYEEAWCEETGIRPLFREASFDTYAPGTNVKVLERCRTYAEGFAVGETSSGLFLMGPIGTGKTHLAAAILRHLHLDWPATECRENPASMLVNVVELVGQIIAGWKRGEGETRLYRHAKETQLLVLDDLGLETDAEWAARQLYELVNYRYECRLPLIVTTNAAINDLTERLGARTISRLTDMCQTLKLTGKDHRVQRRVRERKDLA